MDEEEGGQTQTVKEFRPVAGRTEGERRNEERGAIQTLLRWAVGANGLVMVMVPFLVTKLRSLKDLAGTYREKPEKAGKAFETIVRTQDPDWNDTQVVLDMGLNVDEKTMVVAKSREKVE